MLDILAAFVDNIRESQTLNRSWLVPESGILDPSNFSWLRLAQRRGRG